MMRAYFFALIVLLASACQSGRPGAPDVGEALVPGFQNLEIEHDGVTRTAVVYAAEAALAGSAPLVFLLHGGFGTGNHAIDAYEMAQRADEHGYILVAPDGRRRTWNAGECCGFAAKNDVDDVGFMRALVGRMSELTPIDADRVYATGMSNGAAMSYRLGCEAADVFAAIAPVSGTQTFEPCSPSEPVALLHIHGNQDGNVPMGGGVGDGISGVDWPTLDSVHQQWLRHDGCTDEPVESFRKNETTCVKSSACEDGTSVELCIVDGAGHTWPPFEGAIQEEGTSDDLHASDVVSDFLLRHRR